MAGDSTATYEWAVVRFGRLPDDRPTSGTITAEATDIKAHGEAARGVLDDTEADWNQLGDGRFVTPQTDQILDAMSRVMEPFIADHETVTGSIYTALETFDSTISMLNPLIDDVLSEGQLLNSVPIADRDAEHLSKVQLLQGRVDVLADQYEAAVEECVQQLQDAKSLASEPWSESPLFPAAASAGSFAAAYSASGLNALRTYRQGGRLMLGFSGQQYEQIREPHLAVKGSFRAAGLYTRLGVPGSFLDRIRSHTPGSDAARISNNETSRMLRGLAPGSVFAAAVARSPFLKNSKFSVSNGRAEMRVPLSSGDGAPPRSQNRAKVDTRLTRALDNVQSAGSSKWMRGLGVVGTAAGAYGNYNQAYNESLARDPDASSAEHRDAAAADTTVKTIAEGVGAAVGTKVGASVGAAAGQALIPIPGVGAAIGAAAGGFVGSFVGTQVGGVAGDAVNTFRNTEGSVLDKGTAALASLNPFD